MTGGIKSVIGDAKYANNVLNIKHNLYTGSLFEATVVGVDIVADATLVMAFTTSVGAPVGLFAMGAATLGVQAQFDLFIGGVISGGTPVTQYPRNHNKINTPPFLLIAEGGTIDTPGILIGRNFIIGGRGDADAISGGGRILAPDQEYYAVLTNDDVQTATMFMDITAGRLI